jgi:hypothetical protein
MSRSRPAGWIAAATLCVGACGESVGPSATPQARSVAPRYGDYIVAIDSLTAADTLRVDDTLTVRLFPRPAHAECMGWTLVWTTHYDSVLVTVHGTHSQRSDRCSPIVARVPAYFGDRWEMRYLSVRQPDDTRLVHAYAIEPRPWPPTLRAAKPDSAPADSAELPRRGVESSHRPRGVRGNVRP